MAHPESPDAIVPLCSASDASAVGVSVILIVRNGARYIGAALDSVLRSKTRPLEIIVLDGGSTDDSVSIASERNLTRVLRQQSTGIANAYNEAIAASRGDLIAFISHDDLWAPCKLDVQEAFMRAHPDCLLSVGMVEHFLEPGATPPAGFRRDLLDRPHPGWIMEALMARRQAFDVIGPFNPEYAVSEDTDWFARARDLGVPSAVLPDVLVHKRVHGTNASLTEARISHLLLRAMRSSIERKKAGR